MIPLFGPGWGNYALQGLVEISLPPAVSLLPQTPGWAVLALGLVGCAGHFAWRRYQCWRRDAYRRQAHAALRALRQRIERGDHSALRELAPLLRAAVLARAPREQVASLSGERWSAQLHALAPQLPPLPVAELHRLAYAPIDADALAVAVPLLDQVDAWLLGHRGFDA